MKYVTRARVKVDRVACPWLITRFVDPSAEFLFVVTIIVVDPFLIDLRDDNKVIRVSQSGQQE